MNNQNILKYHGSKLDIKLDSSEFYDYEISYVADDFNKDVLDLSKPITYSTLIIDESLNNFECVKNTINLIEENFNGDIDDYIFSGLTISLNYMNFIQNFNTDYQYTILDSNYYKFILLNNETHYFKILNYNETFSTSDELTGFTESEIISGFTKDIYTSRENVININACSPIAQQTNVKPWAFNFNEGAGQDNCNPILKRRTEKGWTLDFVFNRDNFDWVDGGVFYYIGVRGDDDELNYGDNNLSFQFTEDGRIKWNAIHYSGLCESVSGYTTSFYTLSGQTPVLCTTGQTNDFNVTIVFDRYKKLEDCDIPNKGGWNDLIRGPYTIEYSGNTGSTTTQIVTGYTMTNSEDFVLSGATPNYEYVEKLNRQWEDEQNERLGVLKIYLNGRPIYKLENWEEIIPSTRGVQPFIQSWGGGTGLMNNIHNTVSCFNIKTIKYYEEPLDFVHIRHNFLTRLNDFDFEICGNDCVDTLTGLI